MFVRPPLVPILNHINPVHPLESHILYALCNASQHVHFYGNEWALAQPPKLVAHDSLLNTLALTIYLQDVSIRNTKGAPNRGDRNQVENWSDNNKLRNTLLAAHSALYRTRSDIPAVRITRASRLHYTNWLGIYKVFTLSTISGAR